MRFYTSVTDTIDPEMFKKRVTRAARAVAAAAEPDIQNFVPFRSGRLRTSAKVNGRKITWTTPYAGVLYYGHLFIDPGWVSTKNGETQTVGRKGGFPMPSYGADAFFSRRGVEKIDSGRKLHYHIGTRNWIREAESQFGDRWLKMARKELLKNR